LGATPEEGGKKKKKKKNPLLFRNSLKGEGKRDTPLRTANENPLWLYTAVGAKRKKGKGGVILTSWEKKNAFDVLSRKGAPFPGSGKRGGGGGKKWFLSFQRRRRKGSVQPKREKRFFLPKRPHELFNRRREGEEPPLWETKFDYTKNKLWVVPQRGEFSYNQLEKKRGEREGGKPFL